MIINIYYMFNLQVFWISFTFNLYNDDLECFI